jgi:ADP-heptose:LPS heptosyltransferase
VLVAGTAAEAAGVLAGDRRGIVDVTGRTDPEELAAIVVRADAVLSNDSAAAVLAGLAGTPSVVVAGPTPAAASCPGGRASVVVAAGHCPPCWGDDRPEAVCARSRACMEGVSVDHVVGAIERLGIWPTRDGAAGATAGAELSGLNRRREAA